MEKKNIDKNIVDFIQETTRVITVISESTKGMHDTLIALKELNIKQENEIVNGFVMTKEKIDNLKQIFFYVILPLLGGILSLVGVKLLFK